MARVSKTKTRTIEQTINIPGVTPHDVFELLMDAKQHAALTGGEAVISRHIGGKFVTFDGWANGRMLEITPDQKIVQTWRAADWPIGVESVCTFVCIPVGGATRLIFTQTGVPNTFASSIDQGWDQYYWQPMVEYFGRRGRKK